MKKYSGLLLLAAVMLSNSVQAKPNTCTVIPGQFGKGINCSQDRPQTLATQIFAITGRPPTHLLQKSKPLPAKVFEITGNPPDILEN